MATLAGWGIDAVNLRHDDWSGGLVTLAHRFGLLAFGWDLQHAHILESGLRMGLDAVYSDHVDLMVEVAAREVGGTGG
jgi:glycerophosphoryl diester phosphodiesterase